MAMIETVDDVLAHYGVKGMRWGVRRSSGERVSAAPSKPSGKPAWQSPPSKAKGAMNQPAPKLSRKEARAAKKKKEISEDAAQFIALKQKVKKKGINSLTNEDLKKINQRMELQQKYSKAFPRKKNPLVEVLIEGVLSDVGSTALATAIAKGDPVKTTKIKTALALGKAVKPNKK